MAESRFSEVDEQWAALMRSTYEKLIDEHLANIPKAPPKRLIYAWDALANDYRELACVLYASGENLAHVRAVLSACARSSLSMATLRGADTKNGSPPLNIPTEYATGNSCSMSRAIWIALTSGEQDVALGLAPFVWDPPEANYIGHDSVLCTTSRQTLAYALKYFLLQRTDEAEKELGRLTRVTEEVVGEMLMVRGIVEAKPAWILDGLSRALAWHARAASATENFRVPEYFLCFPALGASALALQRGLVTADLLPVDNVYFPRELIVV